MPSKRNTIEASRGLLSTYGLLVVDRSPRRGLRGERVAACSRRPSDRGRADQRRRAVDVARAPLGRDAGDRVFLGGETRSLPEPARCDGRSRRGPGSGARLARPPGPRRRFGSPGTATSPAVADVRLRGPADAAGGRGVAVGHRGTAGFRGLHGGLNSFYFEVTAPGSVTTGTRRHTPLPTGGKCGQDDR